MIKTSLQAWLEANRLAAYKLAEELGCSEHTVSRFARPKVDGAGGKPGRRMTSIKIDAVELIAARTDIPVAVLVQDVIDALADEGGESRAGAVDTDATLG